MSDRIRISVKGDEAEARAAMRARGLAGCTATLVARANGRSFLDVLPSERAKVVTRFCEPCSCDRADGFPPGTLLFHG